MEEKTKAYEENARIAKLSIDKQLFVQILQEENRTHDETIKKLEEKIQEEKRSHDDAIKELDEKIADLDRQIKSSSKVESVQSIPSETPTEPVKEISEPPQETSSDIDDGERIGALQERVRAVLQEYKQSESENPEEEPKKKKRGLFQVHSY